MEPLAADEDLPELELLEAHIRRLQAELSHAQRWDNHPINSSDDHAPVEPSHDAGNLTPMADSTSAPSEESVHLVNETRLAANVARAGSGRPPLSPRTVVVQRADSPPTLPPVHVHRFDHGSSARPDSWHEEGRDEVYSSEDIDEGASVPREGSGRHRSVSPTHELSDHRVEDEEASDGEPDAYDPSSRGNSLNGPPTSARAVSVGQPLGANFVRQHPRGTSNASSTYSAGVVYEAGSIDMGEILHSEQGRGGGKMYPAFAPKVIPIGMGSAVTSPTAIQEAMIWEAQFSFASALSSLTDLFIEYQGHQINLLSSEYETAFKSVMATQAAQNEEKQILCADLATAKEATKRLTEENQQLIAREAARVEEVVLSPTTPAASISSSANVSSPSRNPSVSVVSATTATGVTPTVSASAPPAAKVTTPSASVDPMSRGYADRSATVIGGSSSRRGSSPSAVPMRSGHPSVVRPSAGLPPLDELDHEPSVRFSIPLIGQHINEPSNRLKKSISDSEVHADSDNDEQQTNQHSLRRFSPAPTFTPSANAVRKWSPKKAIDTKSTVLSSDSEIETKSARASIYSRFTNSSYKQHPARPYNLEMKSPLKRLGVVGTPERANNILSDVVLIEGDKARAEDLTLVAQFVAEVSAALSVPSDAKARLLDAIESNYGDKLRLAKTDIVVLREEKLNAIMDSRRQRLAVGKLKEKISSLEAQLEVLQKKHAPLVANYNAMQTEYTLVRKRADETTRKLAEVNGKSATTALKASLVEVESQEKFVRALLSDLETNGRRVACNTYNEWAALLQRVVQQEKTADRRQTPPRAGSPLKRHSVSVSNMGEGGTVTVGGTTGLKQFGIGADSTLKELERLHQSEAKLQQEIENLASKLKDAEADNTTLKQNSVALSQKYLKSLTEIEAAHEELATLSRHLGDAQDQNARLVKAIAESASSKLDLAQDAEAQRTIASLNEELNQLRSQMEPLQVEVISARRREAAILKVNKGGDVGSPNAAEDMLNALRSENEKLVGMLRALQKDKVSGGEKKTAPAVAPWSRENGENVHSVNPISSKPVRPSLQELASPPNSSELAAHPSEGIIQPVHIPTTAAVLSRPSNASHPDDDMTNASSRRGSIKEAAVPVVRDIAEDTLEYARQRLTVLEDAMLRSASIGWEHTPTTGALSRSSNGANSGGYNAGKSPMLRRASPTSRVAPQSPFRGNQNTNLSNPIFDSQSATTLRGTYRSPIASQPPPTAAELGIQGEMRHWHDVVLRTGSHLFPSVNTTGNQSINEPVTRPTYIDSLSPIRRGNETPRKI